MHGDLRKLFGVAAVFAALTVGFMVVVVHSGWVAAMAMGAVVAGSIAAGGRKIRLRAQLLSGFGLNLESSFRAMGDDDASGPRRGPWLLHP